MADIDEILGQVKLPEKSVPLCLRADLQAEFEELDRQLAAAKEKRGRTLAGDGGDALTIAELMEELRSQMREHTYSFKLRALPKRAWSDLLAKHPAKDGDEGEYDTETFPVAALAACCIDPVMSEDKAGQLVDRISQGQWNELWLALINLNLAGSDIPFSANASAVLGDSKKR